MIKREIKAEQKTAGVETVARSPTPAKRSEKMVAAAAAEKTSPVKKQTATVFEETKKDLVVVPPTNSDLAETKQLIKKERKAPEAELEPAHPKKPCSAYMFFATEHSARLRKEKNLSAVEAIKGAGLAWNTMPETEKTKYNKMADLDVER